MNFAVVSGVPESWGSAEPWSLMIWTTTPWTLPANVAVAVHPDLVYTGIRYIDPGTGDVTQTILAAELAPKVMGRRNINYAEIGRCRGKDLERLQYRHPFIERSSPVVLAQYVSVEDGTGLVHTAPGHGAEDYQTGLAYRLPILSPVDESGRFTAEAPDWLTGRQVFTANPLIVQKLQESGHLFHEQPLSHSYPHCWRCKKLVIFRATEQWFISVDHKDLRSRTLQRIDEVQWLPSWGKNRIEAMVSLRPDWCISRQRSWGVPIPALGCTSCQTQLLTAETVRHFRDLFRAKGADAWFTLPVEELLPEAARCPQCGGTSFRKEGDILDVWFESGSSHRAVLGRDFGLGFPAFVYLEGSDQHRGWFQSSILTAVGASGAAPFENVLTHGFVVDEHNRKISKSLGNYIAADVMVERYGADVLRLYVASMDYADDISVSERGIKEMSEAYRKVRNTFRYLLGNLEDYQRFDPSEVAPDSLQEIDTWMLGELNRVIRDARADYERFEFYRVYQRIYQFCSVELSSFYLDVLKDRLYAELPAGKERRAAQFVLARLHDHLTRLIAPMIPHTAEESWEYRSAASDAPSSVHLAEFPDPDPRWDNAERTTRWNELLALREQVLRALEGLRKSKQIGSAQEARVRITTNRADRLLSERELLAAICNISEVEFAADSAAATESVIAERSSYNKCERCWNFRPTVGQIPAHPTLCERCARVVTSLQSIGDSSAAPPPA